MTADRGAKAETGQRRAYKVVDLRGEISGKPKANQGTQKKTKGIVLHYNGDEDGITGVASGQRTPREVYDADASWHIQKDWGGGARANGIQYHYGVWDDTVYILRDPDSRLWHCGDGITTTSRNYSATAVNVPISFRERATERTLKTLAAFCAEELGKQDLTRAAVLGHKEVPNAQPTQCPGPLVEQFLKPFRNGELNPDDGGEPEPEKEIWYGVKLDAQQLGAFNEEAKAKGLVTKLKNNGVQARIVRHEGKPDDPDPEPTHRRGWNEVMGAPVFDQETILKWGRGRHDAKEPWVEMVPHVYGYAAQKKLGADFLCVQMALETGFGSYGGASRKYNPAGIKTVKATGDRPQDFEVPSTPKEGARMLVNHWCAVLGLDPIGEPHDRYWVAKEVYKNKNIRTIGQLGSGNWATDPRYGEKLLGLLEQMDLDGDDNGRGPDPEPEPGPSNLREEIAGLTATLKYGLDPWPDKVRQYLEDRFGPYFWIEGHRNKGDGTEHWTNQAIDLGLTANRRPPTDRQRAWGWEIARFLVNHRQELGIEGVIWRTQEIGYVSQGGSWTWKPQRWRPPRIIPGTDPLHKRHIHVKFLWERLPTPGRSGFKHLSVDSIDPEAFVVEPEGLTFGALPSIEDTQASTKEPEREAGLLPRIDVGYSALVGSIVGMLMLAVNYFLLDNPVGLATLPVLAVTAVMGLVAYFWPRVNKEVIGTSAGAVVVLVEFVLSARAGDAVDVGSVTVALTFLVQAFFLYVLPRIQPKVS